jgi:drug/metabolite transporter (DMT)-like permease
VSFISLKTFLVTAFALVAFAFNSILCRMALGDGEADAASFTAIRLLSGAVTLAILVLVSNKPKTFFAAGNWGSAFFLFVYAICFSFAYLGLTAATGALILFGSVQFTMIAATIVKGERPGRLEWIGLIVAFGGLVYLLLPGLASPPILNAGLMAAAGVAWGFYTLRGKGSADPLGDTAGNFVRSVPMAVVAVMPFLLSLHLSARGVVLAVLSGAIASGVGYTAWYAVLRHHTATRAAVLQLAVPVIAAVGGVLFISEMMTARLVVAAALILGGIAVVIAGRKR